MKSYPFIIFYLLFLRFEIYNQIACELSKQIYPLLIDDDKIFIMICKKLIQRSQFAEHVDVCLDGKQAIDYLIDSLNSNQSLPDVILLDINMPVMNGWEFLDEYEKLSKQFQINIPIYIISSTICIKDIERSKSHPCVNGFYAKPLSVNDFSNLKDELQTVL